MSEWKASQKLLNGPSGETFRIGDCIYLGVKVMDYTSSSWSVHPHSPKSLIVQHMTRSIQMKLENRGESINYIEYHIEGVMQYFVYLLSLTTENINENTCRIPPVSSFFNKVVKSVTHQSFLTGLDLSLSPSLSLSLSLSQTSRLLLFLMVLFIMTCIKDALRRQEKLFQGLVWLGRQEQAEGEQIREWSRRRRWRGGGCGVREISANKERRHLLLIWFNRTSHTHTHTHSQLTF